MIWIFKTFLRFWVFWDSVRFPDFCLFDLILINLLQICWITCIYKYILCHSFRPVLQQQNLDICLKILWFYGNKLSSDQFSAAKRRTSYGHRRIASLEPGRISPDCTMAEWLSGNCHHYSDMTTGSIEPYYTLLYTASHTCNIPWLNTNYPTYNYNSKSSWTLIVLLFRQTCFYNRGQEYKRAKSHFLCKVNCSANNFPLTSKDKKPVPILGQITGELYLYPTTSLSVIDCNIYHMLTWL